MQTSTTEGNQKGIYETSFDFKSWAMEKQIRYVLI